MGFHIYIKEVIEKPLLTPEAEQQADKDKVSFYPVGDFTQADFVKLEALFDDKLCELFVCEGFFLKECSHEEHQLPFVRVAPSDTVYCWRSDFAVFLSETTTPEIASQLLDFFVEGLHVAVIG